jgi:hypothetical protein
MRPLVVVTEAVMPGTQKPMPEIILRCLQRMFAASGDGAPAPRGSLAGFAARYAPRCESEPEAVGTETGGTGRG